MLVGHYEMLATTIRSLRIAAGQPAPRRGGASPLSSRAEGPDHRRGPRHRRGDGAAAARARRRLALAGIEPDAARAGGRATAATRSAMVCDVRDREQVEAAVEAAVEHLGGLDVVIANAGVAAQLPMIGGDPEIFERTIEVNLLGVYYTLRAAGAAHRAHERGYALAIASLAAAVHPPMLGAYSASKAGVEALADALRVELRSSGASVGVAYFAELDTDMTQPRLRHRGGGAAPRRAAVGGADRGRGRRDRARGRPSLAPRGRAALGGGGAAGANGRPADNRPGDAPGARPGARDRAARAGAAHDRVAGPLTAA